MDQDSQNASRGRARDLRAEGKTGRLTRCGIGVGDGARIGDGRVVEVGKRVGVGRYHAEVVAETAA
jgi:hypothetical protein